MIHRLVTLKIRENSKLPNLGKNKLQKKRTINNSWFNRKNQKKLFDALFKFHFVINGCVNFDDCIIFPILLYFKQ